MRWWLLSLALLLPSSGVAVESECPTTYRSGDWEVRECFLCDGDHSATDCAEFDLVTEGAALPVYLVAELAKQTGCTNPGGVSVDVRGLSQQLGAPHVYVTLTSGGTSAAILDPIRHRHLDADVDITTSADCSDVEVILRLFYQRAHQ